jgi:hypothetical protein
MPFGGGISNNRLTRLYCSAPLTTQLRAKSEMAVRVAHSRIATDQARRKMLKQSQTRHCNTNSTQSGDASLRDGQTRKTSAAGRRKIRGSAAAIGKPATSNHG